MPHAPAAAPAAETPSTAAAERLEVLAEAGAVLGAALDVEATLRTLAHLVVPRLADWCFIEMPADDGRIEPVAIHHADPALVSVARASLARNPVDPQAPHGTGRVLRTGEPELVPEIPDAVLQAVAQDAEHLALLRRMGLRSSLSVPLAVRGRTLGVLSLVMAESGRRLGPDDLPLAGELGRRAALAVENARLFAAEQAARRAAERAAELSRRMLDTAAALNGAVTPDEVAAVCVAHGTAAFRADAGSLSLLTDGGRTFEIVHAVGFDVALTDRWRRFPVASGGPVSTAVATRQPVLLGSRAAWAAAYPATLAELEGTGARAFLAAPVVVAGRAVGGLSFTFGEEREFAEADRVFLAMLGEQAAQALERARLLEAERAARAEAQEANRAKTEFLSAMSHELRTPLNAIAGYVDLLELGIHGPLNEGQAGALARVNHAQRVLLGLISDILNFARVEAGRIEYTRAAVPLLPLLDTVEDLVRPQVAARGLVFERGSCPPGAAALCDADRVRQVLVNLLSNAVKFTAAGGRVRISCTAEGERVAIRVADTGRGIAPEKLRAVFEPFVQLDRRGSGDSQQGVGLGLAISRELAHGMGGDLSVESTPGVGSTFTLHLPAAPGR